MGSFLLAGGLMACADAPPPSATARLAADAGTPSSEVEDDEREEFQQEILSDIEKVDTFLQKTQRGVNLSEFTLGWFAMILINELCAQDQDLYDHVHAEGRNVELYLRGPFQANPKGEIATLAILARKSNAPIRLAARHALQSLTTIPDSRDSAERQERSRADLYAALTKLKLELTRVAKEAMATKANP
ncbi:hypothetical protein CU669_15425 [Paramagnetospirillum kuznetsovii]|uniref:Uncharacterized protein n=2 Tax=Paramagnetospirillum kuznetsovii TaxID=2053833 RepID=A0A364NV71_9PROT|nr:hypothetical protein CU669_15425 [Paramagnetospirillum kuznetsovii]